MECGITTIVIDSIVTLVTDQFMPDAVILISEEICKLLSRIERFLTVIINNPRCLRMFIVDVHVLHWVGVRDSLLFFLEACVGGKLRSCQWSGIGVAPHEAATKKM